MKKKMFIATRFKGKPLKVAWYSGGQLLEQKKTFAEFKKFLAKNCFDGSKYIFGKYDRKIYNWFKKP